MDQPFLAFSVFYYLCVTQALTVVLCLESAKSDMFLSLFCLSVRRIFKKTGVIVNKLGVYV